MSDISKVYAENSLKKTAIYKCYDIFREDVTLPTDVKRDKRPVTSNSKNMVFRAKIVPNRDKRIRVTYFAAEFDTSTGGAFSSITDNLEMRCVVARSVSRVF